MKFKLFGRLRDDESGGSDTGDDGFQPGSNGPESSLGGGGLERTVENLFSQGYSEEEIKQELQGQYNPQEIESAVNNAVASSASGGSPEGPEPMTPYRGQDTAASPMDEGFNEEMGDEEMIQGEKPAPRRESPREEPLQDRPPEPSNQSRENSPHPTDERTEELVETIVAENFQAVEEEFENVYQEIDELGDRMEEMEQRIHDLEVRDDEDQEQFVQKVDEMEDHIDQYQSRIGGLEKAFQQVLPSLVENVRDLTDLVQEIKQERGIETSRDVSQEDIEDIDMDEWDE